MKTLLLSTLAAFVGIVKFNPYEVRNDEPSEDSGNSKRLTLLALDEGFIRQSLISENTADPDNEYDVCCVIFNNEIELLAMVLNHFNTHSSKDVSEYGFLVQLNEDHFYVHIGERYKAENQFFAHGFWHPSAPEYPAPNYRYQIDRNTLEILEFKGILH